jgi:thiamine monophosphate kinase
MIWFFQRQTSRLLYEIRRQVDGDDYELVVTFPDGRQEVEKFKDALTLIERSHRLQESLKAEGWAPPATSRVGGRRFPSVA